MGRGRTRVVVTLTLSPVDSRHTHTKSGARPDTTRTLVNRLLMTAGWSLRTQARTRTHDRDGAGLLTAPARPPSCLAGLHGNGLVRHYRDTEAIKRAAGAGRSVHRAVRGCASHLGSSLLHTYRLPTYEHARSRQDSTDSQHKPLSDPPGGRSSASAMTIGTRQLLGTGPAAEPSDGENHPPSPGTKRQRAGLMLLTARFCAR